MWGSGRGWGSGGDGGDSVGVNGGGFRCPALGNAVSPTLCPDSPIAGKLLTVLVTRYSARQPQEGFLAPGATRGPEFHPVHREGGGRLPPRSAHHHPPGRPDFHVDGLRPVATWTSMTGRNTVWRRPGTSRADSSGWTREAQLERSSSRFGTGRSRSRGRAVTET